MLNIENLNMLKKKMKDQKLIAVTKYVGEDEINALLKEGIHDLGENRVQVFLKKEKEFKNKEITWHFIGHLQSKKVKKVVDKIDVLHSLDRMSLADEIQKRSSKVLACFLEVNISGEENKYGLKPDQVLDFYQKIQEYDKIRVVGLMGMATHTDNESLIKNQFQKLKDLKESFKDIHNLDMNLSMGMTNDYEIAIKMGATHLRIGSLLFEEDK
jgi:pyridoxal phosphate enzyme (YggS family)